MQIGVVGLDADGRAVLGDGLIQLTLRLQVEGVKDVKISVETIVPRPFRDPQTPPEEGGRVSGPIQRRLAARARHGIGSRMSFTLNEQSVGKSANWAFANLVVGRERPSASRASPIVCTGHGMVVHHKTSAALGVLSSLI